MAQVFVERRSPGGRTIRISKLKKHAPARCGLCGAALNLTRTPSEKRKLAKTERRPQRLFGGVLCARCTELIIREATRLKAGAVQRSALPVTHLRWVDAALTRISL